MHAQNVDIAPGSTSTVSIIVGVDPGLESTGYGVIEAGGGSLRCLTYGVIVTQSNQPSAARLRHIFDTLQQVISIYQPQYCAVETIYFAKNVTSALCVAQARGVVLLAMAQQHISVAEYAPNAIKKAITGIAQAEKRQVQHLVKILLNLKDIPHPDHAADALAVAVTHVHCCMSSNYAVGSTRSRGAYVTLYKKGKR
ncbi:crossover junction endoribonuclease subunit C [Treponema paraluiscuniculi Cuniculi A]|uniref:Crossover junction endodeoxyribonuclease RuvC n=3 Tax=Treponema paraluiscuniculi TaxID=53435 RepID=F7XSW6_TREPU|nr:crossover junction endodeoxyribonuclease RuvC [Treponema paraluiscuniculi]AEH40454.1 crossover junction endoribonuclease subunit C [Treponema paraluiscuniculi Cuniculi A]WKC72382.1 crossover junction endoribonuclease subunit C [Treponema paraluiscuniculi]